MKSTIAALAVLLCSGAAAQSAQQGLPDDAPIVASQRMMQVDHVEAFGFETYPAPAAAVTANLSYDQRQLPIAAVIRARNVSNPRLSEFRSFRADKFNRMLIATEFLARSLDAVSSRNKLTNPCRCYREASRFFGLDMTGVFKSDAGGLSYSIGVAAVYSIISAKLWNASKNHPRRAKFLQKLSQSLLIGDSSLELATDIHNFGLTQFH